MDGDELVFLYQLKEGICQSSYAANIATLAGLPASLVQRGVEVNTHTQNHRSMLALTECVCVCVCAWAGVWTLQDRNVYQTNWQSIISWAGKQVCWTPWTLYVRHWQPTQQQFVKQPVTDRCRSVVDKFLSLDLGDKDLDLQHFMKAELLPSAGELLNRSWTDLLLRQTYFCSSVVSLLVHCLLFLEHWTGIRLSKYMARIVLQSEIQFSSCVCSVEIPKYGPDRLDQRLSSQLSTVF